MQNGDDSGEDPYRRLCSVSKTLPCNMPLGDTAELFFRNATGRLFLAGSKAIHSMKRSLHMHKEPKFMRLVDMALTSYDMFVLPTDKDGGFAQCNAENLRHATRSLLSSTWYRQVKKKDFSDSCEEYVDAARSVSIGNPKLRKALLSDMQKGEEGVAASLNQTCKTHKPNGGVCLRPIHAFTSSPFRPGMKWIGQMLDKVLRELPHLVKDANSLQSMLVCKYFPSGSRFLKMDIKDFYLTGAHSFLVEKSPPILPTEQREDYVLLTDTLL